MRFEITDQDLEDEMTSSYGHKRYRTVPDAARNLNIIFFFSVSDPRWCRCGSVFSNIPECGSDAVPSDYEKKKITSPLFKILTISTP